jgi:contact-dependent growth inhibition (CDI) system restriction endonuclease-like protein
LLLLGVAPPLPAIGTTSAAWKLGWAVRGLYFNGLLGADLPPTFKAIDAFSNGVATSIKSIDLRAATYQSAVRLTYRLNEYIDKLVLFDGGKLGAFEVDSAKITDRVLSLATSKGSMTAAQKSAIETAKARVQAFDVKLIITEF